jgi:ABC-2 type transport system permease protein
MKRMWTTLRYTFTGLRSQILGWGLGLGLYGLMIVPMYEKFAGQGEQFRQLIANYPPEFLAFFGATVNSMMTPAGFLGMYAFSMLPVIAGIFAVLAGSGLIVSDEERGRLDLILAHPAGRTAFFFGRFLGLLVQILVYATLALILSLLLPARSLAAMAGGAIMVISYTVSSLAFMDERMATLAKFMPYHYFQTTLSFRELNTGWLFALVGISALMVGAAWLRFIRRDIRLSGEGSWRLPFLPKRRKIA